MLDALLGALVAVGHDRDRARRVVDHALGRAAQQHVCRPSRAWRSRARSAAAGAARSPSAARPRPCGPRRPRSSRSTPRRSRSSLSRSSARWSSPTESLVSPPNHDTSGPPRWTCTTISGAPVTPLAATPNSTGSRELSVGAKAAMTGAMVSASWASMRRDARRGPGGPHPPDGMKSPRRAPPGRGGVHPRPRPGSGERSGFRPMSPARSTASLRPLAPPLPGAPRLAPGLVPRPRLLRALAAARELPLVLLAAPAGFGKTTLLAEWAARDGRPFSWIRPSRAVRAGRGGAHARRARGRGPGRDRARRRAARAGRRGRRARRPRRPAARRLLAGCRHPAPAGARRRPPARAPARARARPAPSWR